ncbi:glycosyltransferase family 1 protein [Russula earlei]|uniref:Glycosyltransferase family 1 protein n=1 Tax=Russula earlei TaxID=71964 RepID=A0ACC0U737_9AGAM|nr:glycosyltransferase family 1 protein [Russula earlei]
MHLLTWLSFGIVLAIIARIYVIVITSRSSTSRGRGRAETCHLAVFLGSGELYRYIGGHSSEALSLVSALDFSRYGPRTYLISDGDSLSEQKACHGASTGGYQILTIPRARRVHQGILTVPFTALRSLLGAMYHVTLAPRLFGDSTFDVLLLNGPGTCVVLCVAVYLNRFLGLPSPRLVYVESFARVRTLSLSGKLLRPIVDRFIVQWPDLLRNGGRGECHGWLV